MNILLATRSDGTNPFAIELMKMLKQKISIAVSEKEFWNPSHTYDIVHFQWPEEFFNWNTPSPAELDAFIKQLKSFKLTSKLVWTVHNKWPYDFGREKGIQFYTKLIPHFDAFLHLGSSGVDIFKALYNEKINRAALHKIIPHLKFQTYDNVISRVEARRKLKIKESSFIILVFGKIRNKSEKILIMNASFLAPIKHKKFIVTNWRFTNVVPKKILHKIILFLNPFIKAKSIYVPQEDIQTYFNACDLVFIPRIDSMNSGILFLALGFGKVVIGPSVGNVQDVLKLTGNPIYIPNDKKSIISAFKQGYNLSKGSKQGEKNKAFAEKELSDEVIIKEYIDLYTELISKKINND